MTDNAMSDLFDQNEYSSGHYDPTATPSTEAIRATYATDYYMTAVRGDVTPEERAASFDRWLAAHDAEKIEAGGFEYAIHSASGVHLWPLDSQDEPRATTYAKCHRALGSKDPDFWDADDRIVRRAKPGAWSPAADGSF